ncbi:MAG: hypothetical protein ACIAXF_06560 [Phycisphaerales bacterium JB063]
MSRQTQPVLIDAYVDREGRVLPGFVCDGCGYDVRGQPYQAECPECGAGIEPMLYEMVMADRRRPWYAAAVVSSVVISALCICIATVVNYQTNNFNPPRLDWFVILVSASCAMLIGALASCVVAGYGEWHDRQGLRTWGIMSAICLSCLMVCCFGLVLIAATN